MDVMAINLLTEMATNLTTLAVKGTATVIHRKIESVKNEKNIDIVRTSYDEIVNQLLSEREDAIRIAQAYKEELDKVVISDEDIIHLHNTVSKILEIFKQMSPQTESIKSFEQLKELIGIDTLKTMQLLGFNYKAAIGEPLTEVCSNAISNVFGKSKGNPPTKRK
jgi:archaellum component FlaC